MKGDLFNEILFINANGESDIFSFSVGINSPHGGGKKYACTNRRNGRVEASFNDVENVVNWMMEFTINNLIEKAHRIQTKLDVAIASLEEKKLKIVKERR